MDYIWRMDKFKFVVLTATFDEKQWGKVAGSFDTLQKKFPDSVVFIAAGIWIIDRTKAEVALSRLTEQLHRIHVPFVVAPVSSRPTIAATESELQTARDVGLDFFPMPFAE